MKTEFQPQENLQFTKNFNFVKTNKELTPIEKLLISEIYAYDSQPRKCYASNQALADSLGVSKISIERSLLKLRKLKIVEGDFNASTHTLIINLPRLKELSKKTNISTAKEESLTISTAPVKEVKPVTKEDTPAHVEANQPIQEETPVEEPGEEEEFESKESLIATLNYFKSENLIDEGTFIVYSNHITKLRIRSQDSLISKLGMEPQQTK